MAEDDEEKNGFHTEEGVYRFTHMSNELKKFNSYTSEDDEEGLSRSKRAKCGNILGRNTNKKQKVEEGRFLDHMVTKERVRADLKKVQAVILSPIPKSPNQIQNLFLQLAAISKLIPKIAELQYPVRMVWVRSEATKVSGWTNEAKEALQRINKKLNKLQTLAVSKEGEILMLYLCHQGEMISSVLLVDREGIQIPISYASRPQQGVEICYTSIEKMVQELIHTTRSQRTIFRKHKVRVVTDGPMEEILKLFGKEGRLARWATKIGHMPSRISQERRMKDQ
nr:hypothetical protein [Tanacetum cinerariifolium]